MMFLFRLVTLLSLTASTAVAFQASLPKRSSTMTPPMQQISSSPNVPSSLRRSSCGSPLPMILSDDETAAILQTAEDCSEYSQCNVDDVAALVSELQWQEQEMTARLAALDDMIAQLQKVNRSSSRSGTKEEDRDQVRAFVRDMLSVFQQGGPAFPTSGFSGDIGDGPTTAYDALPPKKWKNPNLSP